MITTAEQLTYRIRYTTDSGLVMYGEAIPTLQEAADTAVYMLAHVDAQYPGCLIDAEVQCWRDGRYSHTMMRSYRKEN